MPLKREISLLELTLCGMGIILGAGIYVLIGAGAAAAGNAVWLSFAFGAVIAILTGLSYAELSSMYPEASAEYEYARHSFGKRTAFLVGWLVIFASVLGATTVAIGFGKYFGDFFSIFWIYGAVAVLSVSTIILLFGVKQTARLGAIITVVELAGLLFIIFIGIPYIGSFNFYEVPSVHGVLTGAIIVFFAFLGFEELARFSEETLNTRQVMPKALLLSIIASTVLYVLAAVSAVSIVGASALAESDSPLALVARTAAGEKAFMALSAIALFATANTVLLVLLAASRIIYGISKEHAFPVPLHVVAKNGIPWVAVITSGFLALAFLAIGKIDFVASAVDLTLFIIFIIINASLVILRLSKPDTVRPFRVPFSVGKIPVLPLAGIVFTSILAAHVQDIKIFGIVLAVLGTGIIAALIFVKEKKEAEK